MDTNLLLTFLGASVLLTIMPGPDNIFVLTESLTRGRKNGILVSLGLSMGVLVHTSAATLGLSVIIQQSATVFTLIKYLGATYLFYLALRALKEKKMDVGTGSETIQGEQSLIRPFTLVRTGLLMNVLNPKVALFFVAFLPQFVSPGNLRMPVQLMLLGLLFALQALLIFSLISYLAGSFTRFVKSERTWRIAKWSKVAVLTVLGLVLVFSRST